MPGNRSLKPVKVFVVDSGIDTGKSDLKLYVKRSTGFGVNIDSYIAEDDKRQVTNEHGTAISLIIRDICNGIELTSINILSERLTADARVLIYTLCWCLEQEVDIIHLSLGTRKLFYSFALRKIVKEACKKGIIIVAALDNHPGRCYPGYLKGVIGVRGEELHNKTDFYFDGRFLVAPCHTNGIRGIETLECAFIKQVGNSMAAAYITGHVAGIIGQYGNTNYQFIVESLKKRQIK